jgi:hypothetical protein
MKLNSIQAMIADPNIDPTGWVGKALIEWVQKNQNTVLQDPVARKYLLSGMELGDIDVLAKGVQDIYKTEKDAEVVRLFIQNFNNVLDREKDSISSWRIKSTISRIQKTADANTIDALVQIRWQDTPELGDEFLKALQPRHVPILFKNRDQSAWYNHHWGEVLNRVPDEEIWTFFQEVIWPRMNSKHGKSTHNSGWAEKAQNILFKIFVKLPPERSKDWLDFLEKTDVSSFWVGREAERKISKKYPNPEIPFTETVCRCGYVAANKSGYANHKQFCNRSGSRVNLYKAAKVFHAKSSGALICNKCAKTCKSAPGLALHSKKCEGDIGKLVEEGRSVQQFLNTSWKETQNVDKNEDTLPGQTD